MVSRTSAGQGCAYCACKKVSVTNSLATRFPAIAAQLDPDRNGGPTAEQIVAGSNQKVWWRCPAGPDHVWRAAVNDRTRIGSGCPCCAGQRLSVTNSLGARFPAIAEQLDPDRNDGLTADQILAGSNARAWWRCPLIPITSGRPRSSAGQAQVAAARVAPGIAPQ